MDHIKRHAGQIYAADGDVQCRYCLKMFNSSSSLDEHLSSSHPTQTRVRGTFKCIICRVNCQFFHFKYSKFYLNE